MKPEKQQRNEVGRRQTRGSCPACPGCCTRCPPDEMEINSFDIFDTSSAHLHSQACPGCCRLYPSGVDDPFQTCPADVADEVEMNSFM